MKKIFLVCILAFFAMSMLLFAGCEESEKKFTGITFEDDTVVYDGEQHSILIEGTLPDGADVSYTGNSGTDAGTYNATATISKEGYETLKLNATLTISKATFTGITFEDETVIFNGKEHSLSVQGNLPAGTSVRYENNNQTDGGEYTVKAFIENPNYNTLELTATLRIRTLLDAVDVLNTILTRPDAWEFMPEAFNPENLAYTALPQNDFSDFTDVNTIGKRALGKQMNVLYDLVTNSQSILSKADIVFTAGEALAATYQTFINNNPDDYTEFTGTVTIKGIPFSLKISLQGTESVLLIGNDTVSIELSANSETNKNIGRIQITDAVLKYEMTDTSLQYAIELEITNIKIAQTLNFVRDEDTVTGYVYEYYSVNSAAAIKTTALITSNESYTIVTGDKRESDDLLIEAYEEVYDSKTGEMIGAEVAETVKLVDYDTLWFPLYDVSGFSTVKVEDESNGLNADTIYVNGSSAPFQTTKSLLSRNYDIEMKEVWYVVKKEEAGEISYTTEKVYIPMLFVQKKSMNDFADDVTSENVTVTNASLPDVTIVTETFTTMKDTYIALKDEMSIDEIDAFIGEQNSFFTDSANEG